LIEKNTISKVPIAWIDSEEASTTTDLQPYLTMLKSIVKMYKKYFTSNKNSDEFASFIESLSESDFNLVLNNIPIQITKREPIEFTEYDEVKIDDLIKCLR